MESNDAPICIEIDGGYSIMHETGIYFFDSKKEMEENIKYISTLTRYKLVNINAKKDTLAKIVIYLSSNCNLRCIYCYASAGDRSSVVSVKSAKILIDFVANRVDRFILDFHGGGEPLLHFDIIKELYDYAKATGKLYRTVLISNGVLCQNKKEEVLNWIVNHIDVMALSCDGGADIQNYQRPSLNGLDSSKEVENTIRYFNDCNYLYTVRSTITRYSSLHLLDITKYFYSLGVKYLVYSPCYNYGRSNDGGLVPLPDIYGDNYLKSIDFAYKHSMRLTSNAFRFPGHHYCGALSGFNLALTTDNYISSCYEVVNSTDPVANLFIVGEVTDQGVVFFNKAIDNLSSMDLENDNKCSKCDFRLVCRGGCPVKKARNSYESSNMQCAITKYLVPKILKYVKQNPESATYLLKDVEIDYRIK